jgi:hypothetical protein
VARAVSNKKWLQRELDKGHRKAAREKLVALRVALKAARAERKESMMVAAERCRTERLAARERARQLRIRGLAELREAVRLEREAARQVCVVSKGEAKKKDGIERTRAELEAERIYQREMRRIDSGHRQRRKEHRHATYIERRDESDDEVRQNIQPEMLGLWERVKRGIKGSPRESRTERFLRYVEENPGELLLVLEDRTDALVRELEQREREAVKAMRGAGRTAREGSAAPAYVPLPEEHYDDGIPF